jgi:hypothetical protein
MSSEIVFEKQRQDFWFQFQHVKSLEVIILQQAKSSTK